MTSCNSFRCLQNFPDDFAVSNPGGLFQAGGKMMRISTIIPAYNRSDLIGETLRSVLAQSRPASEIIVVDDGSTDGTCDVVTEQFGKDVILIRQRNAGAGAARNAGLARATGEMIHFQDSDDISSLNTYEVQGAAIERGADMAYGPWLKTRFHGARLAPDHFVLQQGPMPDLRRLSVHTLMITWVTVFQPCLFRRSVLEAAGPYRTDLAPSEDMELAYRISRITNKLAHTPETILLYRVHPENQVSEQNLSKRLIDRANVWLLLNGYEQDRADLTFWDRAVFHIKKLEVVRDVRPYSSEKADELELGSHAFHKLARPLYDLGFRVNSKLRRIYLGVPYTRPFAAAPLRASQRVEIERLGYELPALTTIQTA